MLELYHTGTMSTPIISPSGRAPACRGGQLELMCTVTGNFLEWRFTVVRGNETNATEFSRIIIPSGAAMSYLIINSTTFTFSRTSAENSLSLMSRLLISPVSSGLNRTEMKCVEVETLEAASTIIELIKRPFQGRLHL